MQYILKPDLQVEAEPNVKNWRAWMRAHRALLKSSHVYLSKRLASPEEVRTWMVQTGGGERWRLCRALGTVAVETWFRGREVVRERSPMMRVPIDCGPLVFETVVMNGHGMVVEGWSDTATDAMRMHYEVLRKVADRLDPKEKQTDEKEKAKVEGKSHVFRPMISTQPAEVESVDQQGLEKETEEE